MPSKNLTNRVRYAMAQQAAGDELLNLLLLGISTPGNVFYVSSVTGSDADPVNDGLAAINVVEPINIRIGIYCDPGVSNSLVDLGVGVAILQVNENTIIDGQDWPP